MSLKKYMVIPFAEYIQNQSAEPEKVQYADEPERGPYKSESQRVKPPQVEPEVGPEPEPELKPEPERGLESKPEPERGLEPKPEPEPEQEPPPVKEIEPQEEEEAHYLQGGSRGTKRKRKQTQFFWLKP
jgi:hypothetical protein